MSRLRWLALAATAAAALGGLGLAHVRAPASTASMRGLEVAVRSGCFGCHGAAGLGGAGDARSSLGEVPPLAPGAWSIVYARGEAGLRSWICFGRPDAADPASAGPRRQGLVRMPAYEGVLSPAEIDDLVAWLKEAMGLDAPPPPAEAAAGHAVARDLGCFACHGPDGKSGIANPGSFKGYIPPWDGDDFGELVRDDAELREWILSGEIARFRSNPAAVWFLDRQVIRMPPYREHVAAADVDRLVAFVRWVRAASRQGVEAAPRPALPTTRRPPVVETSVQARGAWLYRTAGCVLCHGPEGRGGITNPNTFAALVPPLDDLAERIVHEAAVDEELARLRRVILEGFRPLPRDSGGPPPIIMPAWAERLHADGGPASVADIDAILAWLLTLKRGPAPR